MHSVSVFEKVHSSWKKTHRVSIRVMKFQRNVDMSSTVAEGINVTRNIE